MGNNSNTERVYFVDAIRVIAVVMMFFYHVAMVFTAEWQWHVQDLSQSYTLLELNYWMASFRMPILFFISAYTSCMFLNKLNISQYLVKRFNRLIIPTVIWTLILVPPQIFFERKMQGETFTYIQFYSSFLEFKWWPEGNFHWLHLWFIPYLFVYNILSIPLVIYFKRTLGNATIGKFTWAIPVFIIIAVTPHAILAHEYPVTYDFINDIARHSFYLFFILGGVLSFFIPSILLHLEKYRALYFRCAFASTLFINIIRWNQLEPHLLFSDWINQPVYYGFRLLLNVSSWFWVLTFLGYGKKYLNKAGTLLRYSNKAVYPFYILHQTIIVMISYYVVKTQDAVTFKFIFILFTSFLLTLATYHFFIRPYGFIRFSFGSK